MPRAILASRDVDNPHTNSTVGHFWRGSASHIDGVSQRDTRNPFRRVCWCAQKRQTAPGYRGRRGCRNHPALKLYHLYSQCSLALGFSGVALDDRRPVAGRLSDQPAGIAWTDFGRLRRPRNGGRRLPESVLVSIGVFRRRGVAGAVRRPRSFGPCVAASRPPRSPAGDDFRASDHREPVRARESPRARFTVEPEHIALLSVEVAERPVPYSSMWRSRSHGQPPFKVAWARPVGLGSEACPPAFSGQQAFDLGAPGQGGP